MGEGRLRWGSQEWGRAGEVCQDRVGAGGLVRADPRRLSYAGISGTSDEDTRL
jgi:hypothetical protein